MSSVEQLPPEQWCRSAALERHCHLVVMVEQVSELDGVGEDILSRDGHHFFVTGERRRGRWGVREGVIGY